MIRPPRERHVRPYAQRHMRSYADTGDAPATLAADRGLQSAYDGSIDKVHTSGTVPTPEIKRPRSRSTFQSS